MKFPVFLSLFFLLLIFGCSILIGDEITVTTSTTTQTSSTTTIASATTTTTTTTIAPNIKASFSYTQTYNEALTPSWYNTEKTEINNTCANTIKSYRDLYELGLITASEYESQVLAANTKKTSDIASLDERKYALDNYNSATVSYKVENLNKTKVLRIKVFYKGTTTDNSEFVNSVSISSIPAELFVTGTSLLNTAGKKIVTVIYSTFENY